MINVFENQASCDGTEKSFSVVFNDLNRPDFSSFDSAENFVAGLISLNNLTLNQTINLATTSDGFQNMMLLPEDLEVSAKETNNFFAELIQGTSFSHDGQSVDECAPAPGKTLTAQCRKAMSEFFKSASGFEARQQNLPPERKQFSYANRRELRKARIELSDTAFMAETKETLRTKKRSIVSCREQP